jgi:hypothetical protein
VESGEEMSGEVGDEVRGEGREGGVAREVGRVEKSGEWRVW